MDIAERLFFGLRRGVPNFLQSEAAECGLVCLAMIAGYHGRHVRLSDLRSDIAISSRGLNLRGLIEIAQRLGLTTRPIKTELEHLASVRLPCVLHWDFRHYVVLTRVTSRHLILHDPAIGTRRVSLSKASQHFTGIVLELWPNHQFTVQQRGRTPGLFQLLKNTTGLRAALAQIVLLALCLEIFAFAAPLLIQLVIDHAIVPSDPDFILTLVLGFGILLIVQEAVRAGRAWTIMYFSSIGSIQWRANLFSHLVRLPMEYFERRHSGDILSRFGSIEAIQRTITTSFLEGILDGVMSAFLIVILLLYSPLLAAIVIAATAAYYLVRLALFRPLMEAMRGDVILGAVQQSHFIETVNGIRPLKLFQRELTRLSTWLALVVDQSNARLAITKLSIIQDASKRIISSLENLAVIGFGALIVIRGDFSLGAFMAFIAYKAMFSQRSTTLVDHLFDMRSLDLHIERLSEVVEIQPEPLPQLAEQTSEASPAPTIQIDNVGFRYGSLEPFVVRGISFDVEPGESVAIVGPSGCGKSTLVNLILGVFPPTEGRILIGGLDPSIVGAATTRARIGVVMQDDMLFAGSITDNISMFDPDVDQAWVRTCAMQAQIHDAIAAMPMQYQTRIGNIGVGLSGGQKQRMLLARALYKRPQILILDEATSHLDIEMERRVSQSIAAMNLTRIIVAHRPETIKSASRIVDLSRDAGSTVAPQPRASAVSSGV